LTSWHPIVKARRMPTVACVLQAPRVGLYSTSLASISFPWLMAYPTIEWRILKLRRGKMRWTHTDIISYTCYLLDFRSFNRTDKQFATKKLSEVAAAIQSFPCTVSRTGCRHCGASFIRRSMELSTIQWQMLINKPGSLGLI
jgi:hypothetical protein